ncbi:MAG: acetyl-CoA carboxylase biotin carboxylase subunit [Clostridia bacterium]
MIKKILIANRSEIAVRIIRACRDMGIISVAVYSTIDKQSLHTQIADESVCIGPPHARDSYLNMNQIISAAIAIGADAIHPGFGFLAENAEFARRCAENDIKFIGPPVDAIERMGNKIEARKTVKAAGVPVIPGSDGEVKTCKEAEKIAEEVGFPLMIKACAGGGGKGIRQVNSMDELHRQYDAARSEAKASFTDDSVYIEKCILSPRHIEFQILADEHGNVVHLFERDCSVQRKHQKLIEESPSTYIDEAMRKTMGDMSVRAARAAGYAGAGTIEYLIDENKNFYFMEMNTRIQVEHPVTEMVTGIDIVREQIRIASGEELGYTQNDIHLDGHAIECRINAEDPARAFAPCPGKINGLHMPGGPGVRIDSAVYQGYTIPPFYDSMIAKLIVHGHDRKTAIERMRRALAEFLVDGITINADYQMSIVSHPDFISGDYGTDFIETGLQL